MPPGENTVTSLLENKTVLSESRMVTTPKIVLVKYGMMYPVVEIYAANCGIVSVAVTDNRSTCPVAVHKLIFGALVLGGPCGAVGAM